MTIRPTLARRWAVIGAIRWVAVAAAGSGCASVHSTHDDAEADGARAAARGVNASADAVHGAAVAVDAASEAVRHEAQAIRELLAAQAEAWSRGDLDAFLAGYSEHPPVRFIGSLGEVHGVATIREGFERRYREGASLGALTFDLRDVRILGASEAFVYGAYRLVRETETSDGFFTLMLRKTPDGWRIVHDHSSEPVRK